MIAIAKAIGRFFIPQEYVMAMFFALSKSLLLRKYAKAKRIGKIATVDARRGGKRLRFLSITGIDVLTAMNIRKTAQREDIAGQSGRYFFTSVFLSATPSATFPR